MRKKYARLKHISIGLGIISSLLLQAGTALAQRSGQANASEGAKLAPAFKTANREQLFPKVRVQVQDMGAFQKWLKQNVPYASSYPVAGVASVVLVSGLGQGDGQKLAQCPWVTFVDVPDRKPREEAYLQNADLRVNRIDALHLAFPEIHGKGLTVSVKEQPFDSLDIDLKTRVISSSAFSQATTPHATAMATLIAGAGNSSATSKGVAWQSRMTAANFSNLLPDNADVLKAQGVTVQNHSYGVGVENYYGLESQAYDQQSRQLPTLVHVFSSGNSGTQAASAGPYEKINGFANLTGQFKVSKNTLSVGAIDTSGQVSILSSKGPTYDGRIKPEVVAFGEAGTSEAAAVVSGIALAVQDAHRKKNGGALPTSDLVKAAIINAADDKGRAHVDYAAGFGNADALGAVQSILEGRYAQGGVAQGATRSIKVTVPAGTANVKVTLVWLDREGEPNASKALVNDLDLVLKSASGQEWLPWGVSTFAHKDSLLAPARRKADHLNNVEQVTVANPAAGEYEVLVNGHQVQGSQAYSLVYEFEKAFAWSYPFISSHLEAGQKSRLRWITPVKDRSMGTLEFRYATPGASWQALNGAVDLNKEAVDLLMPDTTALAELRMVVGSEVYETGAFVISPTLNLKVGYQCEDEVMLYWPKAPGAQQYQVYQVGSQFLEPVAQTQDTVWVFKKSQQPALHYAVAPMVQGKAGQRSLTQNYSQQGVGCYVRNFIPKYFVTDTVLLDLQISTTYGLSALYLEKKINGEYKTVQPITLGQSTNFDLQDLTPVSGWNEYRIKLVTKTGGVFYSQVEGLFYTPERYIQVYPTPALAGADLNIITQDDATSQILLYDQTGRLIREYAQDGSIKIIETKGLRPGAYFVKVISSKGISTQTKVILL
ncbi:S8 family serine peptidase [Nibribacter koreensis]|uniref:Por secretion system C-terminal sorting domain-containing protein n=1 Tax=Nibribacter koreensis TaxID=1084519 RepID=A0ABP8FJ52_9BACT